MAPLARTRVSDVGEARDGRRTDADSCASHSPSTFQHPTWPPPLSALSSGCQSTVYTSLRYPFLLRRASASQCTLLPGCVISRLQFMAPKATSPPHLSVAQRLTIIRLIYSLVFITMYHKASHISASKDPSFTFNFRATSA